MFLIGWQGGKGARYEPRHENHFLTQTPKTKIKPQNYTKKFQTKIKSRHGIIFISPFFSKHRSIPSNFISSIYLIQGHTQFLIAHSDTPSSLSSLPLLQSTNSTLHTGEREMETRAAKKRANAAPLVVVEKQHKKQRVVLGELPNLLPNLNVPAAISNQRKEKLQCRKNPKLKKSASTLPLLDLKSQKQVDSDNNAKFAEPYVSDIFEYLHSMEVMLFFGYPFCSSQRCCH